MYRLLDLFCGDGGAGEGYRRAGFDVYGVDVTKHAYQCGTFLQDDAMGVLDLSVSGYLDTFDVIHASPPCQQYTRAGSLMRAQGNVSTKPDLLQPVLDALEEWGERTGRPWVVENVPGAPFGRWPTVQLCGSAWGLGVRRHRLFASNVLLFGVECDHEAQGRPVGVYGRMGDNIPQGGRTASTLAEAQQAMGIDWMQWSDLVEAIPPAYTHWLGGQLLDHLKAAA